MREKDSFKSNSIQLATDNHTDTQTHEKQTDEEKDRRRRGRAGQGS